MAAARRPIPTDPLVVVAGVWGQKNMRVSKSKKDFAAS
jgi:hypothetical protein